MNDETQVTDGTPSAEQGANPPAADDTATATDDLSSLYDQITAGEGAEDGDAPGGQASEDQAPEPSEEPSETAIPRPAAWSADRDEVWSQLPREAQEYIAEREREAHTRISQLGATAKQAEPILDVLKQYPATFERAGVSPAEGISELLKAQELLNSDPVTGISHIANMYGVDLAMMANGTNEQIAQMQSELAALRTEQRLRAEREQASRFETLEQRIDRWAQDKEHYADVEAALVPILQTIDRAGKTEEQILDEAYERAIWATPEVREKILAAEREKQEAEKAKMQRARDAKKAKRMNAGSTSLPFELSERFDRNNDDHMSRLYDSIAQSQ